MKQFLVIGVLVFLSVACSESTSKEEVDIENNASQKENKDENSRELKSKSEPHNQEEEIVSGEVESFVFVDFWEKFRGAVKEGDMNTIVRMTKFPFETRGEMDHDPVIKYNEQQMKKVLPLLLKQEVILPDPKGSAELIVSNEAEIVKNTTDVNREEAETGNVRVGDLVFERGGNGWKFTFAYLNESTYEAIGKNKNQK